MRYYELSYLLNPDLSGQDLNSISEKINSLVQEEGGVLDKTSEEKKVKLGYPIEKKGSAFLKTLTFYLKVEKLTSLEKKLKEIKEIFRFLILTKKQPKAPKIISKIPSKVEGVPRIKEKEKVELKDIEKKLEEILEE